MDWERDLPTWPLADWSRRVVSRPHRWHIQEHGAGPTLLFLHGAGASTHSWHKVMQPLSADHHVVAVDLPGHGFTNLGATRRSGLVPMTDDLRALCQQQGWRPSMIVAHSAGAAVALLLARDLQPDPPTLIAVNPALEEFDGVAGFLFPLMAKALAVNPLTAWAFTLGPESLDRARRLIKSTGSRLSDEDLSYYARLIGDRAHVQGALNMMAQWSLRDVMPRLLGGDARCVFLAGMQDKAVAPESVARAAESLGNGQLISFDGLGHLLHEEEPALVLSAIREHL